MENKTLEELEKELSELKKELEGAEYDLRWAVHVHSIDYMRSAGYAVVSSLRRRESELQREIRNRVILN